MVYLLHFDRPFVGQQRNPNAKKQGTAQHYLGYAENVDGRLADHASGQGATLTRFATQSGITLIVARTWQGDRKTERRLKNSKHHARLCPICNPRAMTRGIVQLKGD